MSATGAGRERARRVPGEIGIWVFILADLFVFGVFFVTVLILRGESPETFSAGAAELNQGLGLLNTLILLTSSLLVVLALDAARAGALERSRRLWLGAAGCGLAFAAVKAVEWGQNADTGLTPHSDDFFMTYFVFTGVHLLHVVIGTAVLLGARSAIARGLADTRRRDLVEGGACYWHMVDLLWLVLYPLFYLVG